MKTLSIFVDESGDFGCFEPHCPYYLFSLVFHDQDQSIEEQTSALEDRPDLCCTMELIGLKRASGTLSKSESIFFGNDRFLLKNYLKPMRTKMI